MPGRSLRLASDYLAPTPVWMDSATVIGDLDGLGLPAPLVTSLLHWQAHFDEHFSAVDGWDSPGSREWYAAEGVRLHDALGATLPHDNVELDLWPVTGQPPG